MPEFPPLLSRHVNECSIDFWYPKNSHLTIPTLFATIGEDFIQYLLKDGIVVPYMPQNDEALSDSNSEEVESDNEDKPDFPEIFGMIQNAIDAFQGVFPKLNWSAPKDASWIAFGNTLRCDRVSDVLLLLKVSEFITFDLKRAYELCRDQVCEVPRVLALRKFQSINQSREFRCFVMDGKLVAVSQRHMLFFKETISAMPNILEAITKFHPKIITELQNYVFDVSVQSNCLLIDVGPCCESTDPLLFEWDEIIKHGQTIRAGNLPLVRVIENEQQSVKKTPYEFNRYPKETFDFSHGQSLSEFQKCITQEMLQQL